MHRRRSVVAIPLKNLGRLCRAIETLEMRKLFTTVLGVDVSSAVTNWSTLLNTDGKQFAYLESSYGGSAGQDNASFPDNLSRAEAAGVIVGAYHFAYPATSTASAEANYFYSIASGAMKPGNLPPVIDIEDPSDDLSTSALSTWVNNFCTDLKNLAGVTPMVYTDSDYAENHLNSTVGQQLLWIANYDGNSTAESVPLTPAWSSNTVWKIHQYNGGTSLSGDNVDLDAFQGTLTQLKAFEIQSTSPEISVAQGSTNITDGQTSAISFGTANLNASDTLSFTVTNSGGGTLTLGTVTTTGNFTVFAQPGSTSLGAGASTTFTLKMTTTSTGSKTGTVSFTNNDSNENPFNFSLSGTVVDPNPTPPTNLHFTTYTNTSVKMAWTDNSNNETAFLIDRKTGSGGIYAQVASLAVNTTMWTDSASTDPSNVPTPGTTYFYRVRAQNGSFFSSYATEESETTLANVPTNVSATDGTPGDRVTITWTASQGAATYQVYRASTATGTQTAIGSPVMATTEDDFIATANTPYYYWVAALNSAAVASAKAGPDSGYRFVDVTPPTIQSASFNDSQSVWTIAIDFSEAMQTMTAGNLSITNLDGGAAPSVTGYVYTNNVATFSIPSISVDAHFRATLTGAADLAGNALSGGNTYDFVFLTGDADGNGTIDSNDFSILAAHFGLTSGVNFNTGDFNYDGVVNALDFNALASRYGDTMPPAGSSPADAAAPLPGATTPTTSLFSNQPISPTVIDLTDNANNSVLT